MARILVAVAESRVLTYLAEGLAAHDHVVHVAATIEDVLDQLSQERFDVIVADIFQPVLEGVALFSTIARASPKTRIVALMDFQSARAKNYDLGLWVDSLILKPFTAQRILNEVEFVLAGARHVAPPLPV